MMARLLFFVLLLLGALALPQAARAACPPGVPSNYWACGTSLSPPQSTDQILTYRGSLGTTGQGYISVGDLSNLFNLTVTDGTHTIAPSTTISFGGGTCTVSGTSPTATVTCTGASVTWPTSADLVVSNGTNAPGGLAPVNGDCVVGSGGAWIASTCGGLASITLDDSNGNSVTGASTLQFGPGVLLGGTSPTGIANLNQPDRLVTTCSGTPSPCLITALDMGGQVNFNGTSLTVTIPAFTSVTTTASVSTTTLTVASGTGVEVGALVSDGGNHIPPGTIIISGSGTTWTLNKSLTVASESMTISFGGAGQSFVVTNYNSTPLIISSTPGINIYPGGATGFIPSRGGMACVSNGATLDCPGLAVQPNQAFTNISNTWSTSAAQTWGQSYSPVNTQSGTAYTLAATDCGGTIITTSSSPVSITTLNSLSVGCSVAIEQAGTGQVTILPGTGTTQNSASSYSKTRVQYSVIGLFVDTNGSGTTAHFVLTGDGA